MDISDRTFRCRDWNALDNLYVPRVKMSMVDHELRRWRPADAQRGWQSDMHLAGAYIGKVVQRERGLVRDRAAHLGTTHLGP